MGSKSWHSLRTLGQRDRFAIKCNKNSVSDFFKKAICIQGGGVNPKKELKTRFLQNIFKQWGEKKM